MRRLLLLALVGCVAGIPRGGVEAPCNCATRALPGYTNASCSCIDQPKASLLESLGVGDLIGVSTQLKDRPKSGNRCECAVVPARGFHTAESDCECESEDVACPAFTSGHPNCWPDQGYRALITWNAEANAYVMTNPATDEQIDTPIKVECGDTGTGFPNCRCAVGFEGVFMWNNDTLTWNNNCTRLPCPSGANGAPDCQCKKGFKESEKLVFDRASNSWNGSCTKVNCVGKTKGITHPDCTCKDGYAGESTFDFNEGTYTATCKISPCVAHASHSAADGETCECEEGWVEADDDPLRFDSESQTWEGKCTRNKCPNHAVGHPNCYCKRGFVGNLTWIGDEYEGTCTFVGCPSGASGFDCKCTNGHIADPPEPQWDNMKKEWTHTCSAISACPVGASSTDVTNCQCDKPGYIGSLSWTGSSWGQCALVNCPPGTVFDHSGEELACKYDTGYTGAGIVWSVELSTWIGGREPAPCPDHTICSIGLKSGYCVKGYAGKVTWNSDQLRWDSTCAKVECPSGSGSHPDCTCRQGFRGGDQDGTLIWEKNSEDGSLSRYRGVCSTGHNETVACDEMCTNVECPDHSSKNTDGSCSCDFGYDGRIEWERPGYTGQCVEAPCPLNATGHGPTCECPKGYLPSHDFGFSVGAWHGQCVLQSCGPHTKNFPDCECTDNAWYSDGRTSITWSGGLNGLGFVGQCVPWPCPVGAAVAGECKCTKGYKTVSTKTSEALSGPVWDNVNGQWLHACEEAACPEGAEGSVHPDCTCAPGYAGFPTWSSASSSWSGCTKVPCEADRNMITLESGQCGCAVGHSGSISWNANKQQWSGECAPATCPDEAHCSGPLATCGKGYVGTVSWSQLTATVGVWEPSCQAIECPDYSDGHPDCACRRGYAGGTLSFSDGDYSKCSFVRCPLNSERLENGNCLCHDGYSGNIQWLEDQGRYRGSCEVAACVDNAVGAPSCSCDRGYSKSVTYQFSRQQGKWLGSCDSVGCPPHSSKTSTNCTCSTGYSGTITWDSKLQKFSGECEQASCPANSGGAKCSCFSGYTGIPMWSGSGWTHACHAVKCPVGTDRHMLEHGGYTCKCPVGTNGVYTWTGMEWDGACTQVSCPLHSSPSADQLSCVCDDGYKGNAVWNAQFMRYDGTCQILTCPSPATGPGGNIGCECTAGYTGACALSTDPYGWECTCSHKGCPLDALRDDRTDLCHCRKGYAGNLVWNENTDDWDGKCERVECPTDAIDHPDCLCPKGYASTVTWDDTSRSYKGDCKIEQCPKNSGSFPDCTPNLGYQLVNGQEITWDATTEQWIGNVEAIPCPANADGKPNCKCNDGYAPNGFSLEASGYIGSCDKVPCTNEHPGFPDCRCDTGYNGTFTWQQTTWASTCAIAPCPANADGGPNCKCLDGWVGSLSWNASTQEWGGECQPVLCPTHADSHPSCSCKAGYTGTIEWSPASHRYLGSCTMASCPPNSKRVVSPDVTTELLSTQNVSKSGVYRIRYANGDFEAYLSVEESGVWVKALQWEKEYTATSQRFGTIATSESGVGKLSDDQINFLLENGSTSENEGAPNDRFENGRMYRFRWQQLGHGYLYVRTLNAHHDGVHFFGLSANGDAQYSYDYSGWQNCTHDGTFDTPVGDCDRVFMGSVGFDCNPSPNQNKRCFSGGDNCFSDASTLPPLPHVGVSVKLTKHVLMHPISDSSGSSSDSGTPRCDCRVGCHGGFDWIRTGFSGSCTCMSCPVSGDCSALAQDPTTEKTTFPCKKGYSGHIRFTGTEWENNCVKQSCPGDSVNWPDCSCPAGFSGDVSHSFSWDSEAEDGTTSYSGGVCVEQKCPSGMTRTATDSAAECSCEHGFSGRATWNMTTGRWDGNAFCSNVPCNDGLMWKSDDLMKCVCPVNYKGASVWNPTTMMYEGDATCTQVTCPDGATCDCISAQRPCQTYFSGTYEWDFATQSWSSSCEFAGCPSNARRVPEGGCECLRGFSPSISWDAQSHSFSGCSQDASCPQGALEARDPESNGRQCVCKDGNAGIAQWDKGTSTYKHSCTPVDCKPIAGAHLAQSGLCDCAPGFSGSLTWSAVEQKYVGSCSVVPCSEATGMDCKTIVVDQPSSNTVLPCVEGYHGAVLWDSVKKEWNNQCNIRNCPDATIPATFPHCACKWGFEGSVSWDAETQDYVSTCTRVSCPSPLLDTGDGHCRCPHGTEHGIIRFHENNTWTHTCGGLATCPSDSTLTNGDCACHKGFAGPVTTVVTFDVQDQSETSTTEQKTKYDGSCSAVDCPEDSLEGSFPDCRCGRGFSGEVVWSPSPPGWGSTCSQVQCPENASGAPDCACKKGYLGTLTFDMATQTWSGKCSLAPCPTDALPGTKNGHATCKCKNGYAGVSKWQAGVGWTHTCTESMCPDFSTKYIAVSDAEYQEIIHSIGCHDANGPLGVINPHPLSFPLPSTRAEAISHGEQNCQAVLDAGGECWGFAVSKNLALKLYTSAASDYSRCDPDTGLKESNDWSTFRRKAATGDCQCQPGYGGGYIWNGNSYVGSCQKDECPPNSDCDTTVTCHQGYKRASPFSWDYETEKWIGSCQKVACAAGDDPMSHPNCKCGDGYLGGEHGWDYDTSSWTGQCTKVDCVENSDNQHPTCRCKSGYVRSDGVTNRIVTWNGDAWQQTCVPVPCPDGSRRESSGGCRCAAGYAGIVSFHAASGTFSVAQGDNTMQACARVSCPPNSIESVVENTDGTHTVVCSCKNGYVGDLTWNFDTFSFGHCTKIQCPAHSTGHPNCMCLPGYAGAITWTGSAYSGACTEKSSEHEWRPLVGLIDSIECHTMAGQSSQTVLDGSRVDLLFSADASIARCDVKTTKDFTRIRGSYNVDNVQASSPVVNKYSISVWMTTGDPSPRYVALGTPSVIVDSGRESGTGDFEYEAAKDIAITATAVPQADVVRVELAQGAGVNAMISFSDLEVYATPDDVTACTKSQE